MVFWGNYTVSPKTSNNLNLTSDWVEKIPAMLNCLERVKLLVSKTQLSASGISSEDPTKEKFDSQFEQAKKIPAKKRREEHSYEDKKRIKLEKTQKKMTEFFKEETELDLHYESSGSTRAEPPTSSPIPLRLSSRSPASSTPSPRYSPSNSADTLPVNSFDESE